MNARDLLKQQRVYEGMVLTVEVVTPAIANLWLEKNNTNRRIRPGVVDMYSRDMTNDAWHPKPVAVCFGTDGRLGNGQHTLSAIIKSGVAQSLLVARQVHRESIAAMDIGLKRSTNDIAHFLGIEANHTKMAIARIIKYGISDQTQHSFSEVYDAYDDHSEVIDKVVMFAGAKKVGLSSPILAACARALYSQSATKIERFINLLSNGVASMPHDVCAVRLRDFARSMHGGASASARGELYRKTENALQHFLAEVEIVRLHSTQEEMFPIPPGREKP